MEKKNYINLLSLKNHVSVFFNRILTKNSKGFARGLKMANWLLILSCMSIISNAQISKVYTNSVVEHSTATGLFPDKYTVSDPNNAKDGDHTTKARLEASPGVLFGAGARHSYIELQFPSSVPANTPVYIVLSEDGNGLLDYLMGGSIGAVLNDIVDFVLTGTPTLTVTAKNGGSGVYTTTMDPGAIGSNRVEIGEDGRAYLKIVPTADFNRVRIQWSNFAVLGIGSIFSGTQRIYIHDVFYNTGTAVDCNDHFLTTSFDAPGISASILSSNPDPVRNPKNAIDANQTNYSELGYSGLLSAGFLQSYKQTINFNRLSEPGDVAVVKYQIPGSLITLTLLDNVSVKAFNGSTEVYSGSLGSLIDVDILGIISAIFGTSNPMYVTIPVTSTFDRIELHYTQLVTAGSAASPLRLYGVYMTPNKPVLASNVLEVCEGNDVVVNVLSPLSGVTYTWYNSSLTEIATGTSLTTPAPLTGESDTFFVTSSKCVNSHSEYVPVVISSTNAACLPSDISGTVNLSDYTSITPIYAVITDGSGVVIGYDLVDPVTGQYNFDDIPKGDYHVVLISGATPPAIGTTLADIESDLGTGYIATPDSHPVSVNGSGNDITVPGFVVEFNGADLRTSITASPTALSDGSTSSITFRVFNIGASGSSGTIYLVISRPLSGTLTLGTLPTGWSLYSTTSDSYILQSTSVVAAGGFANAVVIPATFTASSSIVVQNIVATIPSGFGGGERNVSNNTSTIKLLINN